MAYIIPNATDTTSSNRYAVLDQAEPDSLDFEILGNDRTGIIGNGCKVEPILSGSSEAVQVSAGVVVLNGSIYSVPGNPYLGIGSEPDSGTKRFDLVVARLNTSNNTMSYAVLKGRQSGANPTYPVSKSRLTNLSAATLDNFDPERDVALATLYRATSLGSVLPGHIVDKRKTLQTAVSYRGATEPLSTQGEQGDLYLRTSELNSGESGLYIKRNNTDWVQLAAKLVDPGVPVGSLITWISPLTAPNANTWAECNGAVVSRTGAYSALFAVIGTTYGAGDGSTTFNLPDMRGMFLAGMPTSGATMGVPAGNLNNQVTLTASQIPAHLHPINHGHTTTATASNGEHSHGGEGGSHVHAMDHGHTGTASGGGEHSHVANYLQNANNTGPNHYLRPMNYPSDGLIGATPTGGGHSHSVSISNFVGFTSAATSGAGSTASNGVHTHNVTIPSTVNLNSGPNITSSASAVNIQPRTMYVRYFIRYA